MLDSNRVLSHQKRGRLKNEIGFERTRFSWHTVGKWIPAVIFIIAFGALIHFFQQHSFHEIYLEITSLPLHRVLWAFGAVILSYALLSFYDILALSYLRKKIHFLHIIPTSFTAFALNNSLGMAGVFGNALRFKKYSTLGLEKKEIINLVAVIAISFWLGFLLVGGLALILRPLDLVWHFDIPREVFRGLGILFLILSSSYLFLCFKFPQKFVFFKHEFHLPPGKLALQQMLIAGADWALVALVLYILLPATTSVDFLSFLAIFCMAQTLALLAHVPGGIGVLEALVIYFVTPNHESTPAILAALLVYRILYYFIPFLIAIGFVLVSAIRSHRPAKVRH